MDATSPRDAARSGETAAVNAEEQSAKAIAPSVAATLPPGAVGYLRALVPGTNADGARSAAISPLTDDRTASASPLPLAEQAAAAPMPTGSRADFDRPVLSGHLRPSVAATLPAGLSVNLDAMADLHRVPQPEPEPEEAPTSGIEQPEIAAQTTSFASLTVEQPQDVKNESSDALPAGAVPTQPAALPQPLVSYNPSDVDGSDTASPQPSNDDTGQNGAVDPVRGQDTVEDEFAKQPASVLVGEPAPITQKLDSGPAPARSNVIWRVGQYLIIAVAVWLLAIAALIVLYRFLDPPFSALMVQQRLAGGSVERVWASLDDIAPPLQRAVIVAEDGRFCDHWGVDFEEIQNAINRAGDGTPRGASTISMQVIKNLFLWPSKSYVRKAIELPFTFMMEAFWPKRRVLEVYLNIAEWGPGIFGAEAAAQYHFGKPASRLTEREAARLAAALPNPVARDAGDPNARTARLAADIQSRARSAGNSATTCLR